MDLIKKSALDTESKFKRFFVLFLKEIKGVNYWREYVNSKFFRDFNDGYARKHNKTSHNWWNRNYCIEILGCCNFSAYMSMTKQKVSLEKKIFFEQSYYLFTAFIFIFWEEEYIRYYYHLVSPYTPPINIDLTLPKWKQYECLITRFKSKELEEMVKNWIILKQCYNEN